MSSGFSSCHIMSGIRGEQACLLSVEETVLSLQTDTDNGLEYHEVSSLFLLTFTLLHSLYSSHSLLSGAKTGGFRTSKIPSC